MSLKEDILNFIELADNRFYRIAEIENWFKGCCVAGFDDYGVNFEGTEYWAYGGREDHSYCLTWEELLKTDEEFELSLIERKETKEWEGKVKQKLEEQKKIEKLALELKEEKELYEKLKEKYGN